MALQGTGASTTLVGTMVAAAVAMRRRFFVAAAASWSGALAQTHTSRAGTGRLCATMADRVMTFGVAFQFDSRYTGLEGKWVSANFRYYSVNPAGLRTSGYGFTDYGAPALLTSTLRNPNTGVVYSDYAHFPNGWVQWAGSASRRCEHRGVGRTRVDLHRMAHDSDIHLPLLGRIAVESEDVVRLPDCCSLISVQLRMHGRPFMGGRALRR